MTPFEVSRSAAATLAPPIVSPLSVARIASEPPWSVLAEVSFAAWSEYTRPETTWYLRIAASFALFSGLSSDSTVPSGSAAKAASVGAKTVNGPSS